MEERSAGKVKRRNILISCRKEQGEDDLVEKILLQGETYVPILDGEQ